MLIFFLTNYAAQAASFRILPGAAPLDTAAAMLLSFFFPTSGFLRGVRGILSLARFGKTDLQIAARAGALCTVVKTRDGGDYLSVDGQ